MHAVDHMAMDLIEARCPFSTMSCISVAKRPRQFYQTETPDDDKMNEIIYVVLEEIL